LTKEEVQEIADDTKATKNVEHDENDAVMKKWESEMAEFLPQINFNTDLSGKSDDVYYHFVEEGQPQNIRGAYFSGDKKFGQEKGTIDFFILDKDRKVVYSRRKRSEGLFNFNATKEGEYMFVFSNLKVYHHAF
jgi:hypothetical protein